jgi:predicted ester cyclase
MSNRNLKIEQFPKGRASGKDSTVTKPDQPSENELRERAEITATGRDISSYQSVSESNPRRQVLAGFDLDYTDFVDYIIRCTHKIWEEKAVGLIYTHYTQHCPIYMTDTTVFGREAVVEGTLKTLAAFPDARLFGDEVIWSGNETDGFHSSHRITWTARNTGYSSYGPPTNRRILRRGIAHCFVRENKITEEWLVRDELALVRQLGFDEVELAKRMARLDALRNASSPVQVGVSEVSRLEGQHPPRTSGYTPVSDSSFDVEDFVRALFQDIWNCRLLNRVKDFYVAAPVAFVSTARKLEGVSAYQHFVLSLLAAFPDAGVSVDHICWVGSGANAKVAVRWTFQGTHLGPGWYGDPSGKPVKLLCISHLELEAGRVAREYTIYDEFALLKQIHAPNPGEL